MQYETFKVEVEVEVIVILHQEFKSFIMLKRISSKPQIMPVLGITVSLTILNTSKACGVAGTGSGEAR